MYTRTTRNTRTTRIKLPISSTTRLDQNIKNMLTGRNTSQNPSLNLSRLQRKMNSPFWPSPLFKSQLVKDGEDFLLKKETGKNSQGFGPYQNKPFYCVNTTYLVDRCICPALCRSRQTLEKNVLSWALAGTGSVLFTRQVAVQPTRRYTAHACACALPLFVWRVRI